MAAFFEKGSPAARKRVLFGIMAAALAVVGALFSDVSPFRPSSFGVQTVETVPTLDAYVRNTSWETGYLSSVPYRKGDVLEFAYFVDSLRPYFLDFDWPSFLARYDVESVTSDSGPLDKNQISTSLLKPGSRLSIRAKAKSSGSTGSDPFATPKIRQSEDALADSGAVAEAQTGTSATGATDASAFVIPLRTFSSDTNNAVRIVGAPKGFISSVVIGASTFRGADLRDGYVFVTDRGTFADGDYFVAVYAKDGRLLPLKDKVSFITDGQSVGVSGVTPASVPATRDSFVTLQGRGFSRVVSIQLSNSLVIKNASFRAVDDTVAIVRVPAGVPAGEYAMNIMDVNGISSPKRAVIRITK